MTDQLVYACGRQRRYSTVLPHPLGLLALFGSAVFAIMNILVVVNAVRVFGS
ncbi:hypothetical protein [Sodalis sp.]|uniref:hypothetical protein n=1 Tax=Sodalis sp. (in: enterobacteria) TaxID=1898979 RepID=UPI003873897D